MVTPKAPVFVTLRPQVQPAGQSPVFYPEETEEPIKLGPSSYWVLRLPFSYVGEVVYYPPPQGKGGGKLIKGLLNVISMSETETEDWELEQGGGSLRN